MRGASLFIALCCAVFSTGAHAEKREFLITPFVCTASSHTPALAPKQEKFLHEIRGFSQTPHRICAYVEQFQILRQGPAPKRQECRSVTIATYTVMCRGGAVSAAQWWAANDRSRNPTRLAGRTLLVPMKGGGGWSISPGGSDFSGLRLADGAASYVPLPEGFGFSTSFPVRALELPLHALSRPALDAPVERPASAPFLVRLLAEWHPWLQWIFGALIAGFSVIAYIGSRMNGGSGLQRIGLLVLGVLAIYGISQSHMPATMPDGVFEAATRQAERLRQNQAELTRIVRVGANGMVEPIAQSDLPKIDAIVRGERLVDTEASPALATLVVLGPSLLLLFLFALPFLRGWHYLFVSHPATRVAGPPLRSGALFPKVELAHALRPDPAQLFNHPPAYKSRDMAEKAQALRDKIEADADIAAAAMRRDRARAAKMHADAELREARKKLPWWQRWMWW
jgi:hypothetical protein